MGRIGAAAAPAWAALALPLLLLLLAGVACPGARAGLTSEYRRHLGSAIDMPLDADVFRPPPGHNAPEQVRHRKSVVVTASATTHTSYRKSMFSACSILGSSWNLYFVSHSVLVCILQVVVNSDRLHLVCF